MLHVHNSFMTNTHTHTQYIYSVYSFLLVQTAVFMGCKSGEIEIGFSNVSQVRLE